jgi:hypothetical protein
MSYDPNRPCCSACERDGTHAAGRTCTSCSSGSCPTSSHAPTGSPTSTPTGSPTSTGIATCTPMPFLIRRVDYFCEKYRLAGVDKRDDVILSVLSQVYPSTPEGDAIDWASLSSTDDVPCLLELARRVATRVDFVLATAAESASDDRWMANGYEVLE